MSPDETVTAFIRAIEAKDVDGAMTLVAPDLSYENVPLQPIVGIDNVAQTLAGFLDGASEVEWQIVGQWASGATVFNERVDRFKIGTGWLEMPVAGVFRIDDAGKIELWRDYFDLATYTRQLTELTS
jgi:limonene-1,2-epoxide hydrolase